MYPAFSVTFAVYYLSLACTVHVRVRPYKVCVCIHFILLSSIMEKHSARQTVVHEKIMCFILDQNRGKFLLE